MALIKCNECGNEISDKTKTCIHCGNPIKLKKILTCSECGQIINKKDKICEKCGNPLTNKKKTIKNIIFILIGALILTFLAGVFSVFICNISVELAVFCIGAVLGIYFAIVFLILYIKRIKKTKKKINIFIIPFIASILIFSLCSFVLIQDIRLFSGVLEPEIDNRTPKEKLIDYLIENENATYSNDKCSWTFTVYGLNDTFYYTLDFSNKKFTYESYINGKSYYEYDYSTDKGYSKDVSTTGWTVTTEVNVTFDDEKETYEYRWTSSIQNMDSVAKIMAGQINDLRNNLKKYCNYIEIDINDL